MCGGERGDVAPPRQAAATSRTSVWEGVNEEQGQLCLYVSDSDPKMGRGTIPTDRLELPPMRGASFPSAYSARRLGSGRPDLLKSRSPDTSQCGLVASVCVGEAACSLSVAPSYAPALASSRALLSGHPSLRLPHPVQHGQAEDELADSDEDVPGNCTETKGAKVVWRLECTALTAGLVEGTTDRASRGWGRTRSRPTPCLRASRRLT